MGLKKIWQITILNLIFLKLHFVLQMIFRHHWHGGIQMTSWRYSETVWAYKYFQYFSENIRPLEIINLQPFCSAVTPFVCLLRIKIHSMAWKNILGIASHYTAVICKLDDFIACSDLKIATVFVTTCVEYSTMPSQAWLL